MKSPLEIEFKYNADGISLKKFVAFCEGKGPLKFVCASGWDHFYDNNSNVDCFYRHRVGVDTNQLTFKRKTTDKNSFIRTEHNIDLIPTIAVAQIEALCKESGYLYNTSIFKNCFIYKFSYYTLVYYICYDLEMNEAGRFVEIEMSEEHPWTTEDEAWGELLMLEKLCKSLGISAQSRVKRSLFEMFKKETKV